MTTDPYLRELTQLRRVKDRTDREYEQQLDVESLAKDIHMSASHFSRRFKAAYQESPYSYLMTRRIDRAMALLRKGDLPVTEVCFAVGCSLLGTFSTRSSGLVGMPPSVYKQEAKSSTAGIPARVAKQVTRPVRNREAPAPEPPPCAKSPSVVQEPVDQRYKIRDCAFRDPAGNTVRINQQA